jgi:hypothetical protein
MFSAIVFVIFDCGYVARCALEIDDASLVRIDNIMRIIKDSKFGIHDISRTELDEKTKLPRFNMPLELGMFLSAKRFGTGKQKEKVCLILDKAQYRYQKFISDIAGQDIQCHKNSQKQVIKIVRAWLSNASKRKTIPGGREIYRRYEKFRKDLPNMCQDSRIEQDELTFNEYTNFVSDWLREQDKITANE